MIVIANPLSSDEGHSLNFDRNILRCFQEACSSRCLYYLSGHQISGFDGIRKVRNLNPLQSTDGPWRKRWKILVNYYLIFRFIKEHEKVEFLFLTNVDNFVSGLIASLIPRRIGVKTGILLHNNIGRIKKIRIERILFRRFLRRIQYILVFEELFKEYLVEEYNKKLRAKTHVVFFPQTRAVSRGKGELEKGTGKIVFLGGVRREKGAETLMAAFRILDKGPDLIRKMGIRGRVEERYLRQINPYPFLDVHPGYLSQADYEEAMNRCKFVIIAHENSFFGIVSGILMDALSCRTPVIISNIPVHRYYFRCYGALGIMFEAGNPFSLVQAIQEADRMKASEERYRGFLNHIDLFLNARSDSRIVSQLRGLIQ